MARKSRTTISQRITSIYVLIENIKSNESVKTSLFGSGYEESLFNSGETMYTEVKDIIAERIKKNKLKLQASRKVRKLSGQCFEMLAEHREFARKVFKDNEELLSALGVSQPLKRRFTGKIEQGIQFYTTAIEYTDVQEGLAPLGITLVKLQQGFDLVKELSKANAEQEEKKGEVQVLTARRNKKLEELYAWASNLILVLRVVYKDEPQTLEQF
ncbi:MAG: hypothetical protein GTN82_39000, partial [Candidatus Aminicenantes bacterium]|nr:hypothetical protein [Candidatus Aminicenantes bacterium]NIR11443.1 hypothetical protein [Candidatus Aminicenantes bacterium]